MLLLPDCSFARRRRISEDGDVSRPRRNLRFTTERKTLTSEDGRPAVARDSNGLCLIEPSQVGNQRRLFQPAAGVASKDAKRFGVQDGTPKAAIGIRSAVEKKNLAVIGDGDDPCRSIASNSVWIKDRRERRPFTFDGFRSALVREDPTGALQRFSSPRLLLEVVANKCKEPIRSDGDFSAKVHAAPIRLSRRNGKPASLLPVGLVICGQVVLKYEDGAGLHWLVTETPGADQKRCSGSIHRETGAEVEVPWPQNRWLCKLVESDQPTRLARFGFLSRRAGDRREQGEEQQQ